MAETVLSFVITYSHSDILGLSSMCFGCDSSFRWEKASFICMLLIRKINQNSKV